MRDRPADVVGGTYFFIVNLAEWKQTLLVDHADVIRPNTSMSRGSANGRVPPCIVTSELRCI
jgi:hypothetical protein